MNFPYSATTAVEHGGTTISAVHQDIIQTHILTRLDGPTLAATSCASSHLHSLSTHDNIWREICTATWPSIADDKVRRCISEFPAGHRSFFSDSFPVTDHQEPSKSKLDSILATTELISCVDVYYKNALIISKAQVVETVSGWFHSSPFRMDLFDSKEPAVMTPLLHGRGEFGEGDTWLNDLEENLSLSWILIDPSKKRAVNLSSGRPVAVERQWLTGDVQARFATIMMATTDGRPGSSESVKCDVTVTCAGTTKDKEGEALHVREVSMQVEDMEGRSLSGRESLVILRGAMESRKRRKRGQNGEVKARYEEFVERKRVRKEMRERRERALDLACVCFGVTIFLTLWFFILLR